MQLTTAGWPELRWASTLRETIRNVGFLKPFAADAHIVGHLHGKAVDALVDTERLERLGRIEMEVAQKPAWCGSY